MRLILPAGLCQGNQMFMKAVFSVFSFSFTAFLILIFFNVVDECQLSDSPP